MTKEELLINLNNASISVNDKQAELLEKVLSSTLEANEKFNLTAIKDEADFREKMIFDSVLPLSFIDIKDKKCIDIGTGAGFPGLVLSILSDTDIDLLDATKKKIDYINELATSNSIKAHGINARSEVFAKANREIYDYAFARAVSELHILIEIIIPLLKVGGTFIAYKGPKYLDELKRANKIMDKLGVKLDKAEKVNLPISQEERYLLFLKKEKVTPTKYPREYNEIIK